MAINLNNTTPAAPSNTVNGSWQQDGSGNVSVNLPSAPKQLPASNVDATAQSANIAATTPSGLAVPTAGLYRVTATIIVTTAATTSSTLPSVVVTWTDKDNNAAQSYTVTPTNSGNVLTTFQQATVAINVSAANPIQYSTTGYASSGATAMQYAVHLKFELMN